MLRSRPVLLAIAAFFAFGLMPIFTREAQANILAIAAWRAILVAAIFGVWTLIAEGGPKALWPDKTTAKLGTWYGLALALASSTFVGGYAFTTVANTIFLHNLAPVVAFPLAWWLYQERLSASAITGAAVAVLGVGMLSGVSLFQVSNYASSRFLLGDFLSLISAIGYALVLVLTRLVRKKETPLLGTLWVAWVVAAVSLSAIGLSFGVMTISWSALLWVLGLAAICTNIPFYLLNLSMKHIPAGLASVLSMSEVIFATAVGILVYSEQLAFIGWLGGALVVVGLLYPLTNPEGAEEVPVEDDREVRPLQAATLRARSWRLGLALLLFNAGAIVLFVTSNASGIVLSWAGLCMLIRLAGRPALQILGPRFSRAIHWMSGGSALAIGLGLSIQTQWLTAQTSLLVLATACITAWLDRYLANQEHAEDRETQPLMHLALGAIAFGQIFSFMPHPASRWWMGIAAVAVGLQAWTVLLAALRGRLSHDRLSTAPGVARLESLGHAATGFRPASVALFVGYAMGGIHIVPAGHQAIVEQWGKPDPAAHPPGLLVRLPPPIDTVRMVNVEGSRQVQIMDSLTPLLCRPDEDPTAPNQAETEASAERTMGKTMVSLEMSLHYKVSDPHLFAYGSLEPETAIAALGRSALIETVAAHTQHEVLVDQISEIEQEVLDKTQALADHSQLGIKLESVHLIHAAVPTPVLSAFLDVASAKSDEETLQKKAMAYRFDRLPRAAGEAQTLTTAAEIEQIQRTARAQVDLDEFKAISNGIADDRAQSMERLQMEHIERVLERANLIIAPESIGLWLDSSTRLQPTNLPAPEGP